MGWSDSYLHGFRFVSKKNNWRRINIVTPMPDDEFHKDGLIDERITKIINYFDKISRQCVYEYDFGDGWEHTVVFERELARDLKAGYPQCMAGKNARPPEDCGGVWGYRDLQKILKSPRHKEHEEMVDWLCLDDAKDFDPYELDLREVYFEDPKKYLIKWNRGLGRER